MAVDPRRLTATDPSIQALLTSGFQLGLANDRHWHEIRVEGKIGWVCYSLTSLPPPAPRAIVCRSCIPDYSYSSCWVGHLPWLLISLGSGNTIPFPCPLRSSDGNAFFLLGVLVPLTLPIPPKKAFY